MHRRWSRTRRCCLMLAALLIGNAALAGETAPAPAPVTVPLSGLLPPPPASGSPQAGRELAAVLQAQRARDPASVAAAQADAERSVFRFADAIGFAGQAASLPRTAAFFERVAALDKAEAKQAKLFWKHPRPDQVSSEVHALSPGKPDDWSYPSGHATFGYTTAVLLANMLPEKREAIFARAELYAQHRLVLGVHFPSDLEAGKLAGTTIADGILRDATWRSGYADACAELRHALGLPAAPTKATSH